MDGALFGALIRHLGTLRQAPSDAELLAQQWERWLLRGIVRCACRRPAILAGAPRFVTGAVQEYLSEAAEYGELCAAQEEMHRAEARGAALPCDCDNDGPCSTCTLDERCDEQLRAMRRARGRAGNLIRRWCAGEWDDVGPAEAMPETLRSAS